jgi:hypothetical protein
MKAFIIKSIKELIADRYLLVLLSTLLMLTVVYAIVIGLSVHPSEIQSFSHYSDFGGTHYYKDQWTYLISFVFFGLVVSVLHIIISVKLLTIKGHSLAIMYAWSGIGVLLFGWIMSSAVLGLQ